MIRTVKIISPINKGKLETVHSFLVEYNECVNYFIKRLWAEKKFDAKFLDKDYTDNAKSRFDLTFRLIQCAGKQAMEIVKSQRKLSKSKQRIPRFNTLMANLDSRFWELSTNVTKEFDWIKLQSGFKVLIPFRRSTLWNKWIDKGFNLSKSMRILIRKGQLILEFFFCKDNTIEKDKGATEGLDLGYVNLATCSDGQMVGYHLNEFIRTFKKREKHTHKQITQKCYEELKKLDLSGIKVLVLEDLNKVKNNTRGKFSRTHNRRLSHWLYAKVTGWLVQRCEEQGIRLEIKFPWKTSQFCRFCGKWDRRNRSGESFVCKHCGHEDHADSNGAQNLKLLGLAGVYSLRSLPTDYQAQFIAH